MSGLTIEEITAAVDAGFQAAAEVVADALLLRESGGGYDPATGTRIPGTVAEYTGRALLESLVDTGDEGLTHHPDGRRWLVKGLDVDPAEGDRLRVGGLEGRITATEDMTAGARRLWRITVS